MPLQWNSRSRSALLASIRTCHIVLKSRKGPISSKTRSCSHSHKVDMKTKNFEKQLDGDKKILTRGMNSESFNAICVKVRIQLTVNIPLWLGISLEHAISKYMKSVTSITCYNPLYEICNKLNAPVKLQKSVDALEKRS
jgi:hypothetical protein